MRKLYLHIGLPKTGTTFLQEVVFPETSFYYLGKNGDIRADASGNSDPYLFFKFLLNSRDDARFADLLLNRRAKKYYDYYREIILYENNLLLSDEGFTGNSLYRILPFIIHNCKRVVDHNQDLEACFRLGGDLAGSFIASDEDMVLQKKREIEATGNISIKIQKFLDALGAELGGILLVKRDFGSWFISFFLQYIKIQRLENTSFKGGYSPSLMFVVAGFAMRLDLFLKDSHQSSLALPSSFSYCIERHFGKDVLDIAEYSQSPSAFSENLKPVLTNYGIKASSCDKVCDIGLGKNITKLASANSEGENEIFRSRRQFSHELNRLM